ncbi:MAG: BatA domain-containing protein [Planctomycetales bacterium]
MIPQYIPDGTILAVGFGAPWLLWGMACVAIPWLLHLLTKRQYRQTEWAAMKFLLEALRKNSRRIRLEHLLLLIVRTLLIAIVVGALARPLWTGLSLAAVGMPCASRAGDRCLVQHGLREQQPDRSMPRGKSPVRFSNSRGPAMRGTS